VVKKCGIAVESARAAFLVSLQVVAGEPLKVSGGHIRAETIYSCSREGFAVSDVLCADWWMGKYYIHRRLWPALVTLAGRFSSTGLPLLRKCTHLRASTNCWSLNFPSGCRRNPVSRAELTEKEGRFTVGVPSITIEFTSGRPQPDDAVSRLPIVNVFDTVVSTTMIAVYRLASEKRFPCRILGLHKNHSRENRVFLLEEKIKNRACAYKTIDLYASMAYAPEMEAQRFAVYGRSQRTRRVTPVSFARSAHTCTDAGQRRSH